MRVATLIAFARMGLKCTATLYSASVPIGVPLKFSNEKLRFRGLHFTGEAFEEIKQFAAMLLLPGSTIIMKVIHYLSASLLILVIPPVAPPARADGPAAGKNEAPLLAVWDFPVIEGSASPTQTSGEMALGTFTGFFADISTEQGGGIIAHGTSWQKLDSAIGIILRLKAPTDLSAVTSITFTIKVDHPPAANPGIQAYVQNGRDENFAGDYNFFVLPPTEEFRTFTYKINPQAKGLDMKKITTFRIKVSGPPASVTGSPDGKYPVLHVRRIVMQ